MLQWWSFFPDLLTLLFRFLRLSYGCHQNPEGGEKDELFIEQFKLWLTFADSLYNVGRTLHFRHLQSSRALEKSLLTPVDPKKPFLWETNSSSLSIIIAYHHNTPLISLNHNNKSLRAWESSALWAVFFWSGVLLSHPPKPKVTDTPLPDSRRYPETFQNIVDLHKHSYTSKISSRAGFKWLCG